MKNLIYICLIFVSFSALGKRCDLSEISKLHIKSFDHCSQKKLDKFYRQLLAGRIIPDGPFKGKVQLAKPGKLKLSSFIPNFILEKKEFIMERFWKGKVFYRENPNKAFLSNLIFNSKGKKQAFRAHVYYGESFFDPSRLSIIIDYRHNEDVPFYNDKYDWLVGSGRLAVRDEIRYVKEGLYLGRAYVKGNFALNFVLERTTLKLHP